MREMEHSVEALTPLTLCVFPRAKLWELYSKFPSLAFDITWLAAREEQLIDEQLLSVGRRTALERTAYRAAASVRARQGGRARQRQQQHPVSVHPAASRRHARHVAGAHQQDIEAAAASKAMRWKDRVFEIIDRAALERIAGDDGAQHKARPFI